jgi:hypothetical protein
MVRASLRFGCLLPLCAFSVLAAEMRCARFLCFLPFVVVVVGQSVGVWVCGLSVDSFDLSWAVVVRYWVGYQVVLEWVSGFVRLTYELSGVGVAGIRVMRWFASSAHGVLPPGVSMRLALAWGCLFVLTRFGGGCRGGGLFLLCRAGACTYVPRPCV